MKQEEKQRWRRKLLGKRLSLMEEEWREKSDRLKDNLHNLSLFTEAKTILAYFSFRQEPDLSPLFTDNHRWGFPRCVGKTLSWHFWQVGDKIQTGAYGIREPHPDALLVTPTEVDLILVPGVACDYKGYRLGYGGGFYDRMLSAPEWQNIPTMGIVFDFAYVPQLPVDEWDKQLDSVCTN
ncbi:MAG: 5-formyltetrahydrofolate cyclo-ligase [Gomphosphaeria aponina SAG 52.96 = DSM 107014]|uniref:5-formyltetrahydrofolate cyclo-ligase n=1 Tax=Gomphosphaeria aponina SAG 52.96 = DSM 107014 TaxID=1521640 RepID=A0A941GPH1_9CHRO|nr:5-formyltetrahydrofolate cyclo-ligase [Gomphosphaeria aponina SAG 52.96 = DSM 107014]